MTLLDTLKFPDDLGTLSTSQLETLASEIRERLVLIGDTCGGHLASNLGVVEITLALHTIMDSPKDKFLWDTSHQCYVHKMLTGRLNEMMTIRQDGGLSGFAKIDESKHDIFGAGHASTALSAALGVAAARDIKKEDHSVIAVVGDASLSGGMTFEALNNINATKGNFICILNDNNMSISPPVGSMSNYITQLRTSDMYNTAKDKMVKILDRVPSFGVPLGHKLERTVDRLRDILLEFKVGVLFEEFGFRYLGPIDGHNITHVMAALKYAKSYPGPILLHMITKKGKGVEKAEENPVKYHGVKPLSAPSPTPKIEVIKAAPKPFTQYFGQSVCDIAKEDKKIVVITPAMQGGSGLDNYAEQYPDRYFDVGIAEEHAVTFAAGLARNGLKPIVAIYSTFLQRGYDQLVHDVCLQKLPVIFALDRAGLVGEDGPTHHGVLDINYMLPIPDLTVLSPKDGPELDAMMKWAVKQNKAISLRYPKSGTENAKEIPTESIKTGRPEILHQSRFQTKFDITIIGVGHLAWETVETAKILENKNIHVQVINPRFLKPIHLPTYKKLLETSNHIVIAEDGNKIAGFHDYIFTQLASELPKQTWQSLALPDSFITHGKIKTLRESYNLTPKTMATAILEEIPSPVEIA